MISSATIDLRNNDTIDDSTNHPTTEQSMAAVLKRLPTCTSRRLRGLCSSFRISEYRGHDILVKLAQDHLRQNPSLLSPNGTIPLQLLLNYDDSQSKPLTVDSLTQLSGYQLWTFSDICGIPYTITIPEFAGIVKNKLLDSASPLVGEGGMVNLQFTPKPSKQEISYISNMPIHINRLEELSLAQLVIFCKMLGVSSDKPKAQLVEEMRLYSVSNPSVVTEDGLLIRRKKPSSKRSSNKKAPSKPMYLHSLDTSHMDDIRLMCRSYRILTVIPKEQLLERIKLHLQEHPEAVHADGTVDFTALLHSKD
ncbi:hypothetical protein BASA60_006485 [Batrachochytrium salamandrivorans]|nr:hypothetical protein BASA60_006485 [Batrachochytrium salamandrivorans]